MNTLISYTLCNAHLLNFPPPHPLNITKTSYSLQSPKYVYKRIIKLYASSPNEQQYELNTVEELKTEANGVSNIQEDDQSKGPTQVLTSAIDKDLKKAVQKTAATFAPRASTASKNPAVPGSTLYTVFEVQAYVCMLLGGALSFNLLFPSNEPDLWRLMGMWSIWMFTIPSLRARDCSKNEKEALNYLFLLVPLLNVAIPFFVKSFAVVWSADTVAFFGMYAWKMGWLQKMEE
ncbi:protein RESISTANCE TO PHYTOPHTHORA 1, chloroplastic [Apium graveolens]|uniref:Resistance to phytophthora 1 n=1 Tax=Apium graveolens TaxID=4045 RepID=A0A6L5B885_APIGR|nr:hypothetical protein AG4045_018010 [Apium graveolens]